mgnify:CR=1 FL=1
MHAQQQTCVLLKLLNRYISITHINVLRLHTRGELMARYS